jgi:hypothetical protein
MLRSAPPSVQRDIELEGKTYTIDDVYARVATSRTGKKLVGAYGDAAVRAALSSKKIDGQTFAKMDHLTTKLEAHLKEGALASAQSASPLPSAPSLSPPSSHSSSLSPATTVGSASGVGAIVAFVTSVEGPLRDRKAPLPTADLQKYLAVAEHYCDPFWVTVARHILAARQETIDAKVDAEHPDTPERAALIKSIKNVSQAISHAKDSVKGPLEAERLKLLTELARHPEDAAAKVGRKARAKELSTADAGQPVQPAEMFAAYQAISVSKKGVQERQAREIPPPTDASYQQLRVQLLRDLPTMSTEHRGAEVIEFLAWFDVYNNELASLMRRVIMALVQVDRGWTAELKPAARNAICEMVRGISEVGRAKGAVGELEAVVYALPRKTPLSKLNVGKTKSKNPTGSASFVDVADQTPGQEVDVSFTEAGGGGGGDGRQYVEAKYDMSTFLEKAKDIIDVGSTELPKQMHSYQMVRGRVKAPSSKAPKSKSLTLFIADAHDWLMLFLPRYQKQLNALLVGRWKIVVAGSVIDEAYARKLAAWLEDAHTKKLTPPIDEQPEWAARASKEHPPNSRGLLGADFPWDRYK